MKFPEITKKLFALRGITEDLEEEFLNPSYDKLFDPFLLPDMEKASARVIEAINKNEHILVFSDYDADGIPGAVVLSDFFRRAKYPNVSFYIPHRHDEGFGLNIQGIDEAKKRGAGLIITVDLGTADLEEIKHANKLGIDVIVTDHHEPKEKLPKAYALVNPKRSDSNYPFKDLCGSAVVYKLVQAIWRKSNGEKWREGVKDGIEKWSLDMVGLATLSDMVPLVGENRILARFGLEVLKKSPRPGLQALFRNLSINQNYLTEDDITFMITPRINAASRMGKPEDAFKLLSTDSPIEAERLALHLEAINSERKGVVAALVKDAKKHLKERNNLRKIIVVGNPEWRPALLGLVANSLVEEFERPVFVWGRDGDGTIKGSCRSSQNIDLFLLMTEAGDSFLEFGGHKEAGGFSATLENISKLEEILDKTLEKIGDSNQSERMESIEIEIDKICEDLWETVSPFAPFGTGNPKPVFRLTGAQIKSVKNFGKTGDHLEVIFSNGGKDIKAISFFSNANTFGVPLAPLSQIILDAHLEKSYFRNRPEIRLRIVDITK